MDSTLATFAKVSRAARSGRSLERPRTTRSERPPQAHRQANVHLLGGQVAT